MVNSGTENFRNTEFDKCMLVQADVLPALDPIPTRMSKAGSSP